MSESVSGSVDVTLRALEADLIARFADDVAHEVRNPLNALVINFEVLRRRVTAGDAAAALERIDVLADEVHRVHRIIERLIALLRPARAGDGSSELLAACDDVLPLLAVRARAMRTTFEPATELQFDVGMPLDRLRFVLLDTGMAALDFAGVGGHLSCIGPAAAGVDCFVWRASGASVRSPSGPDAATFRLTRAILALTGGDVDVRAGQNGAVEVVVGLPAVA